MAEQLCKILIFETFLFELMLQLHALHFRINRLPFFVRLLDVLRFSWLEMQNIFLSQETDPKLGGGGS